MPWPCNLTSESNQMTESRNVNLSSWPLSYANVIKKRGIGAPWSTLGNTGSTFLINAVEKLTLFYTPSFWQATWLHGTKLRSDVSRDGH